MKQQLSRGHLLAMSKEIQEMLMTGSVFRFFLASKIKEFGNNNGLRVQTGNQGLTDIFKKYHEVDEAGKPIMNEVAEGEQPTPKLKPFQTVDAYQKERAEYLNEEVTVDI